MLTIVDDKPKKQSVLIIDNRLLLGAGVVHLLSDEARFSIVNATSLDGATLLEIIKHLQPEIVIVDETYLLSLSLRRLMELLNHPQLRVITANASDDRVKMYYKQQRRITRVADLVHNIRGSKKNGFGYTINRVRPKNPLKEM